MASNLENDIILEPIFNIDNPEMWINENQARLSSTIQSSKNVKMGAITFKSKLEEIKLIIDGFYIYISPECNVELKPIFRVPLRERWLFEDSTKIAS